MTKHSLRNLTTVYLMLYSPNYSDRPCRWFTRGQGMGFLTIISRSTALVAEPSVQNPRLWFTNTVNLCIVPVFVYSQHRNCNLTLHRDALSVPTWPGPALSCALSHSVAPRTNPIHVTHENGNIYKWAQEFGHIRPGSLRCVWLEHRWSPPVHSKSPTLKLQIHFQRRQKLISEIILSRGPKSVHWCRNSPKV